MKKTALIMAGGRGERFWPKSRKNLPKQFLSLTSDGKTMIQLTVERILPFVSIQDVYVVTNKDYKELVIEQLPDLPKENILCEPIGRNTAPCIGFGAVYITHKYEDAVMIVLPSDHLIKHAEMFCNTLKEACEIAESGDNLVTLGITPSYPETGYGYIKFISNQQIGHAYEVERFVEKPDYETANKYFKNGEYLWNSGMFIWKTSTILKNIREYMPELYNGLEVIKNALATSKQEEILRNEFEKFVSISIDYGILEKSKNIYTLPGNFGWDDVGAWLAISRIRDADDRNNIVSGNVITVDSRNCIIEGADKLIATIGLQNLIIIDTKDATLICNKDDVGNIKKILEILKNSDRLEYI